MLVTCAKCTYNRSKSLDRTLARFRHLDLSSCGEWELLVVNNNCSDDTDAVIQRIRPTAGATALGAAAGQILCGESRRSGSHR